jgi:hypothetical protein
VSSYTAATCRAYALQLGTIVEVRQHDSGQTWIVSLDGVVWRGSFQWGEEDAFFARLNAHLNTLPWPREDDPRIQHEGAYLP